MGQGENGRSGRLPGYVSFQVGRQFRLNVLRGPLLILRRSRFAEDVRRICVEVEAASGQAAQFFRPQASLDCCAVKEPSHITGHAVAFCSGIGHRLQSPPLFGQQRSPFLPPVRFGIGFLHRRQGVAG